MNRIVLKFDLSTKLIKKHHKFFKGIQLLIKEIFYKVKNRSFYLNLNQNDSEEKLFENNLKDHRLIYNLMFLNLNKFDNLINLNLMISHSNF